MKPPELNGIKNIMQFINDEKIKYSVAEIGLNDDAVVNYLSVIVGLEEAIEGYEYICSNSHKYYLCDMIRMINKVMSIAKGYRKRFISLYSNENHSMLSDIDALISSADAIFDELTLKMIECMDKSGNNKILDCEIPSAAFAKIMKEMK